MRKHLTVLIGTAFAAASLATLSPAQADGGEPGSSSGNPIVLASLDDLPAGAVVTGSTKDECATTTTATLTVPGSDESSHEEFRYLREVPGNEQTSHQEWGVEERTRTSTEEFQYERTVKDYKTEYHFAKFTHTKTKARNGQWSAYGPWTKWSPETHTSWEDSTTPLGSPAFHGQGTYANGTQWYREWQAMFDGQTRQVSNGSHTETSDWLTSPPAGDGWVQIDTRTTFGDWSEWAVTQSHLLFAPTLPANSSVHEYRATGPVTVVDSDASPARTEYFVMGGEPSENRGDASWVLPEQVPAEQGWTEFEHRTVVDEEGTPESVTYYAFNDEVECDSPPPVPPENPPSIPQLPKTGIDAPASSGGSNGGLLVAGGASLLAAGAVLMLARRRTSEV